MINIPEKCKLIFNLLEKNGFECYAVGGCVRDSIMGNVPMDWDFTTNALPDEICRCFNDFKTVDIGKEFGTICVVVDSEPFEITTYRRDGDYSDSRHPDFVSFTSNINDDLARRDFTINSVAYNEKTGFVDPFSGVNDIQSKVIRCTGVPKERFTEDALRILRAVRFASRLGFSVDIETSKAMHLLKDKLSLVHPQRIRKELTGILMAEHAPKVLNEFRDILCVVLPEIEPMFDLPQSNPHHIYDVWTHTLNALGNAPSDEVARFAVFFHDIGKPSAKTTDNLGIDHFKKHPYISAEMTAVILRRFGFANSFIEDVCLLIKYHDERFRLMDADIKRVLSAIGEELFEKLMSVSLADTLAQSDYQREYKLSHRIEVINRKEDIIAKGECYKLSQLAINGADLVDVGFKGKAISDALNNLLKLVIKGKCNNSREELLLCAKSLPKEA